MNKIIFDLPMNPLPDVLKRFSGIHTSLQQITKEHFKLYLFDDNYKKGSLLLTKFQWPLVSLNEEDRELFIFRTKYYFPNETQLRYIPVSGKQYLILYYLSSDTDFQEISDNKITTHKRGDWIISCLNTGPDVGCNSNCR